jgi:TATA-binding protein-associated factor Taf7
MTNPLTWLKNRRARKKTKNLEQLLSNIEILLAAHKASPEYWKGVESSLRYFAEAVNRLCEKEYTK